MYGKPDAFGDVLMPGAFASSLAEHRAIGTRPLMLWSHDPSQLDFPQFDRAGAARRPEMMSVAMPHDGLLGELVPPAGEPSGGVGMRWRQSIEDSCAAGAT